MAQLTNTKLTKPRAPPVYNIWARSPEIKALVDEQYKLAQPKGGVVNLNLLRIIKSRLFDQMVPYGEKPIWRKRSLAKGKVLVEEWEQGLVSPPATDPESRQRLVLVLHQFNVFVLTFVQLYRWDYSNNGAILGSSLCAYRHGCVHPIRRARASRWWTFEHC